MLQKNAAAERWWIQNCVMMSVSITATTTVVGVILFYSYITGWIGRRMLKFVSMPQVVGRAKKLASIVDCVVV